MTAGLSSGGCSLSPSTTSTGGMLTVHCLLFCFQVWPQVNDKLVKYNLVHSVFYKPDAISSQAVTPLWEESVGVQK